MMAEAMRFVTVFFLGMLGGLMVAVVWLWLKVH
jgi:hypothetical protein